MKYLFLISMMSCAPVLRTERVEIEVHCDQVKEFIGTNEMIFIGCDHMFVYTLQCHDLCEWKLFRTFGPSKK